jgi:hypothetical protein
MIRNFGLGALSLFCAAFLAVVVFLVGAVFWGTTFFFAVAFFLVAVPPIPPPFGDADVLGFEGFKTAL